MVTQSGWEKQAQSDAQGLVSFDMPWQGTYVAETSFEERIPGERMSPNGAERYDGISYATTLTFVKDDGLPALPAGPLGVPGK